MEITAEAAIEATPISPATFFGIREPKSASTMKLVNGIAGISHRSRNTSSSHSAGSVRIQGFILVVQLQQQRQTNRHLGRGRGQNEDEHHLSVRLRPARPRHYKSQ